MQNDNNNKKTVTTTVQVEGKRPSVRGSRSSIEKKVYMHWSVGAAQSGNPAPRGAGSNRAKKRNS